MSMPTIEDDAASCSGAERLPTDEMAHDILHEPVQHNGRRNTLLTAPAIFGMGLRSMHAATCGCCPPISL